MSKNAKRRNEGGQPETTGLFASVKANRGLIVVGILVLAALGWGAISSRRTVPTSIAVTPMAPPPTPQYAANAPVKEYVYAGSKLLAVSEPVQPVPADVAVGRASYGG